MAKGGDPRSHRVGRHSDKLRNESTCGFPLIVYFLGSDLFDFHGADLVVPNPYDHRPGYRVRESSRDELPNDLRSDPSLDIGSSANLEDHHGALGA